MLITLTTDFGTSDWFVGAMKGVMASIATGTRIIDITHQVPAGNLTDGAYALAASAPYFPPGTIHVAVVDPGVGSARRAIALRTQRAIFIGPDNGVLSWAVREDTVQEVRSLTNTGWFLEPVSQTFHGRDVFAPVAARLAAGSRFEEAGELVDDFIRLPWPRVGRQDRELSGRIVYIDHFGNAITNLPVSEFPPEAIAKGTIVAICEGKRAPIQRSYAGVARGKTLSIPGSNGLLELAINGDDFAEHHGVEVGSHVRATWE